MEYHSVKWHTSLFRNGVPLLEIILLGTPKRHIIFSLKKLATELLVAFLIATASTHLVNSSVSTMDMDMEPQLDEDFNGWCVFRLLA